MIRIVADATELARAAAQVIAEACSQAIQRRGVAYLALAGGATPCATYKLLSQPEFVSSIDWRHLQVFWSDERLVPPDNPDSNFRVAAESLLSQVPIPSINIHRMRGELMPDEAAREYEAEMRCILAPGEDGFPCFDLILVGMGDDGHIASLFPRSPALLENRRWVVAAEHNLPPPPLVPRLTLTLPVINAAAQLLVVVSGQKKAVRMRQVLEGEPEGEPMPAQLIKPISGRLLWLLDQAAAGRLARP